MEFTEIIAECLGFLAIGIGFLIFQQKTRTGMLAMKLSADILWIIHFLLIGATSGMIVSIVGVVRSLTFFILSLKGKNGNSILLCCFVTTGVMAILLTWKDIYSICSIIVCILATVGYWQKKPERMKIFSIFVCLSQISYAICVSSVSVVVNELITLSSIVIFFSRVYINKKNQKYLELNPIVDVDEKINTIKPLELQSMNLEAKVSKMNDNVDNLLKNYNETIDIINKKFALYNQLLGS